MPDDKANLFPVVSVGLPVFNGEKYLAHAINSLLLQNFGNFELIISDNASTDSTRDICLSLMAQDSRIRYYRNEKNMGPIWNYNRVFELSSGTYFMWAAHDDYWDPRFIQCCLEAFNKSSNVVLVGVICRSIKPDTGKLYVLDNGVSTMGLEPGERFKQFKSIIHSGSYVGGIFYGLYKREVLKRIMPPRNVIATDHLMLSELCFLGEFVTVPEILFVKRFGGVSDSIKNIAAVMNIKNKFMVTCPYLAREAFFQKIIFRYNGLKGLDKILLSFWSLSQYVLFQTESSKVLIRKRLYSLIAKLTVWIKRLLRKIFGI